MVGAEGEPQPLRAGGSCLVSDLRFDLLFPFPSLFSRLRFHHLSRKFCSIVSRQATIARGVFFHHRDT